ncbi:MAG: AlpA family transcriptional regulator [Gammaproteobacteria bacterium]|nr:AlpA family transcriptional regulator [Gammaproteobacteria bacterium]
MIKILRLSCVMERTGLSRSSIYAYIQEDKFPAQIQLGERRVGWLESEISDWIQGRIAETRNTNDGGA